MEIREVAVIGLGTMGAGIAEVFARGGLRVTAIEADPPALARGMEVLDSSLTRSVARGRLTAAERAEVFGRIRPAASAADAATADLVIEVVPERMEIKRRVFEDLEQACGSNAILATNTSSLSVTAIAAGTARPGRVVGMHFFNPAPVMGLVEVVTTVLTDPAAAETVTALAGRLGKTPVQVTDRAGFVANALLLPYLNHAVRLLETGYASRDDIDAAVTGGIGLPMGPLTLLDLIGLDTSLSVLEVLQEEFGGQRYTPAPLLRRLTTAGRTGRKSGRGFYDYRRDDTAPQPSSESQQNEAGASAPGTITLIDAGGDPEGELASAIAGAGCTVSRDPAQAGELVLVAAAADHSVLAQARQHGRPADAVGVHLPAGLQGRAKDGVGVAELVRTPLTSAAAAAAAAALVARLGLRAVQCPDRPGFLAGALLYPHLNDAIRMVQDGYASPADVDAAMTLGCGYPRGPVGLLDDAGLQPAVAVLSAMHRAYAEPGYAPVPLLAELAAAGLTAAGLTAAGLAAGGLAAGGPGAGQTADGPEPSEPGADQAGGIN
ncbi:MAG TPA: 3-hydroxyacyl-CoA dehydrogenase NAD-binding domain-containing protein [Streptosporangiaceae bacterium]